MPPAPGVMVAVGRPVAAAYPTLNPRAPASGVVPPVRTPALLPMPSAPGVGAAIDSAVAVEASPPVSPPMVRVASVQSQTDSPIELQPSPPPRYARRLLLPCSSPAMRRFKEVGINVLHVCNAHAHEGLLR